MATNQRPAWETPKRFTATNDSTGALIKSRPDNQDSYASGWDLIWGKKDKIESAEQEVAQEVTEVT